MSTPKVPWLLSVHKKPSLCLLLSSRAAGQGTQCGHFIATLSTVVVELKWSLLYFTTTKLKGLSIVLANKEIQH